MTLPGIAALTGLTLMLLLAAMVAAWAVSLRRESIGFIDGLWPLAMTAAAATAFIVSEGDPVRNGLLLWLVTLWAVPQAWRRLTPQARAEAGARYARVEAARGASSGRSRARTRLWLFFLPQGAVAWLTALPVQLGQVSFAPPVGALGWTGAVLAVIGIALEGLGALRRPTHGDDEAQTPIGRWLGRPDRLGDLAVWWGLFLIAVETGPGRWSVIGPLFLTLVLVRWTAKENPRRLRDGG